MKMNNADQLATTLNQFSEKYSRRVWYARTALGSTLEEVRQEEGFEDTPADILQQMLDTKRRYWDASFGQA